MPDHLTTESARERLLRLRKERERAQYVRLHASITEQRRNIVLSTSQRVANVVYVSAAIVGCAFGLYFVLVALIWPLVTVVGR